MLVAGDRRVRIAPRRLLREITTLLLAAEGAEPGPHRHDLLTHAFVTAAGLAQGVADAEFEAGGADDLTTAQEAVMSLLLTLARKLTASASSGFAAIGPATAPELVAVVVQPLPKAIGIRTPKGFAHSAIYPEAYLKAAAGYPWSAPPLVIGLHSVAAGPAALVGAATDACTVVTLRPHDAPFQRKFALSPGLRARLAAHEGPFAIVDEGSTGSAFGAAADLLQGLGVAEERIVLLPSHKGEPGPEADPVQRGRATRAARPVGAFEDLLADEPLEAWFEDLTGPISRVENLSGGAWRTATPVAGEPPPIHAAQERLKFLLHTASGRWLAKFAGLGETGIAKLERAQALHRAGFTPEPLALRRGFLLERWEDRARGVQISRSAFVAHLGDYLGFRAASLPAEPGSGASLSELVEMARVNAAACLGGGATPLTQRLAADLADAPVARPVHIDGRLHAWEWLCTPDGLWLKTDAVDHSVAHDLVGCQDIAWDVAGAATEFDLTSDEVSRLCAAIARAAGARPAPALLRLFSVAYPAFQAGYWRQTQAAASAADQKRTATCAGRYVRRLAKLAERAESAE